MANKSVHSTPLRNNKDNKVVTPDEIQTTFTDSASAELENVLDKVASSIK